MGKPVILTKADWQRIGAASVKWADEQDAAPFREAVEEVVRARLVKAWAQGHHRGWIEGVADANDTPVLTAVNPYELR